VELKAREALEDTKLANELASWVFAPVSPKSIEEALRGAQYLNELGAPGNFVAGVFQGMQKRLVGRPNKRHIFIKAFEFQLISRHNSQGKAVRNFCPC